MEIQELRVGNYVYSYNGSVIKWGLEHFALINDGVTIEHIKPIELTEEVLLKIGFVSNKVAYKLENDKFILELYFYDCWNLTYIEKDKFGNGSVELQGYWNLHQLQNLYYALCNEELNVKL